MLIKEPKKPPKEAKHTFKCTNCGEEFGVLARMEANEKVVYKNGKPIIRVKLTDHIQCPSCRKGELLKPLSEEEKKEIETARME